MAEDVHHRRRPPPPRPGRPGWPGRLLGFLLVALPLLCQLHSCAAETWIQQLLRRPSASDVSEEGSAVAGGHVGGVVHGPLVNKPGVVQTIITGRLRERDLARGRTPALDLRKSSTRDESDNKPNNNDDNNNSLSSSTTSYELTETCRAWLDELSERVREDDTNNDEKKVKRRRQLLFDPRSSYSRRGEQRKARETSSWDDGKPVMYIPPEETNLFNPPLSSSSSLTDALTSLLTPGPLSCSSQRRGGAACSNEGQELGLSLKDGSLGTCAVVGLGKNLLERENGGAIDGHDTVVRMNAQFVEGYEKYVGKRTSISYLRLVHDKINGAFGDVWGAVGAKPELFYLHASDMRGLSTFQGKTVVAVDALAGSNDIDKKLYRLLRPYVVLRGRARLHPGHLKPTSGLRLITQLLHSRLCTRISLFGFSEDGIGHYFTNAVAHSHNSAKSGMVYKHVAGLEYFVYQSAMRAGQLCVMD